MAPLVVDNKLLSLTVCSLHIFVVKTGGQFVSSRPIKCKIFTVGLISSQALLASGTSLKVSFFISFDFQYY